MQIKFLLKRLPGVNVHTHPPYKIVTSGRALENYPAGYSKVSTELIFLARAIVLNQDFIQFVRNYRQKYGLPLEGFEAGPSHFILKNKKYKKLFELARKLQWNIIAGGVQKNYSIHPFLKPHLFSIIWCNTIEQAIDPVSIYYASPEDPYIAIHITHNIIFSELIRFLRTMRTTIEANLKGLPSKYLTETNWENIRLLSLQTKRMTEFALFEKAQKDKVLRKSAQSLSLDAFHKRCGRARKLVRNLFIIKRT